jgi:hypothetical protein
MALRLGRGIALPFRDRGIPREWVISSTPQPHFNPGKDPVPIVQEAGWAPGPVWKGGKSRPTGIRSRTVQPRSSVAIPTELLGPQKSFCVSKYKSHLRNSALVTFGCGQILIAGVKQETRNCRWCFVWKRNSERPRIWRRTVTAGLFEKAYFYAYHVICCIRINHTVIRCVIEC